MLSREITETFRLNWPNTCHIILVLYIYLGPHNGMHLLFCWPILVKLRLQQLFLFFWHWLLFFILFFNMYLNFLTNACYLTSSEENTFYILVCWLSKVIDIASFYIVFPEYSDNEIFFLKHSIFETQPLSLI